MADPSDLDKLFDAALHERKAPSRFGTPEEHMKVAPAAFLKSDSAFQKADDSAQPSASPFIAATSDAKPFAPAGVSVFQAAPAETAAGPEVVLDQSGVASLDHGTNAELEAILDKKIAKEKGKKRRDRLIAVVLVIGLVGGVSGWFVTNPEKMAMLKKVMADVKTASDPNAVADQYKESLEKVAVRGNQLDGATEMIGGEAPPEGSDQGMDKEMKEVAGDGAGLSASEKQKLLQEKLDALKKKKGDK